jgi:DNA repair protein RadA/Sms
MPRIPAVAYRCSSCGSESAKWHGRCSGCQEWGTVVEVARPTAAPGRVARPTTARPATALPIAEVDGSQATAVSTGFTEFDRVLGGGLVPGAVVLAAGEPGIGKSTLLLAAAARLADAGSRVLLVTGEESPAQVRNRAARVGALSPQLFLAAETDIAVVLATVDEVAPDVLVVDSVQTMASTDVDGISGGVTQVRESAAALVAVAKRRSMATLLVGHVTKDGSIAGPRTLEHVVDVVLQVEGERGSPLRMVRAVKNRFGPTDEIGCFTLDADGVADLPDPSALFVSRAPDRDPAPGTCVTATVEGRRPLVAEVQALVAPSPGSTPRRAVSGLDSSRLAMILAVAQRRLAAPLAAADVYAATIGGVRLTEPAVDLAVLLAVVSALQDEPLPGDLIAIGEVGLGGDVRRVPAVERRLAAAARMGFRRAVVPAGTFGVGAVLPDPDLSVIEVPDVATALAVVLTRRPVNGVPSPGIRRITDAASSSGATRKPAVRNRLLSTAPPKEADASTSR